MASDVEALTDNGEEAGRSSADARLTWRSDWWFAAILVGQVAWGTAVVARSQFYIDDFLFMGIARELGMGSELLQRSAFGHFIPAYHASNWFIENVVGADNYWFAAIVMVLMHLSITLVVFAIARQLRVDRRLTAAACLFVAVTPVMASGLVWWAAALCLLPSTALNLGAFLGFIANERGRRWGIPVMVLSFIAACLFWEKSLTVAAYIGLYSVLVSDSGLTGRERLRNVVGRWRVWLSLAVPGLVTSVLYISGDYAAEAAPYRPTASQLLDFLGTEWFKSWWPMVLGRRTDLYVGPTPVWTIIVGQIVVLALVVAAFKWCKNGRAVVAFFLVTFFVNMTTVGLNRGTVPSYMYEPRYHFDNVYLLVLSALSARVVQRRPKQRHSAPGRAIPRPLLLVGRGAAIAMVACWLTLSLLTSRNILLTSPGPHVRPYLSTFESTLARVPSGSGLVDKPNWVYMSPGGHYPYNFYSRALDLVADVPFTTDPDKAWVVEDVSGEVVPAAFVATVSLSPPSVCTVGEANSGLIELPLGTTAPQDDWVIKVEFDGQPPPAVSVLSEATPGAGAYDVGPGPHPVPVEPGSQSIIVATQNTTISSIVLVTPDGFTGCVTAVQVGKMAPK